MTRAPVLRYDNTGRPRADLGPSYGNTLVERYFRENENPYRNLKDAHVTRVLEFFVRQVFKKSRQRQS